MAKKQYTVLDMETVFFDSEDVIVTSGGAKIANAQADEVLNEDRSNKGDVMY